MYPNFNVYIVLKTELSHLSHLGLHHVGVTRKDFGGIPRLLEICSLPKTAVVPLQDSV